MNERITEVLVCLALLAAIVGGWLLFASVVMSLAYFIPSEELVTLSAGVLSLAALFIASGLASRMVGKRLARLWD